MRRNGECKVKKEKLEPRKGGLSFGRIGGFECGGHFGGVGAAPLRIPKGG